MSREKISCSIVGGREPYNSFFEGKVEPPKETQTDEKKLDLPLDQTYGGRPISPLPSNKPNIASELVFLEPHNSIFEGKVEPPKETETDEKKLDLPLDQTYGGRPISPLPSNKPNIASEKPPTLPAYSIPAPKTQLFLPTQFQRRKHNSNPEHFFARSGESNSPQRILTADGSQVTIVSAKKLTLLSSKSKGPALRFSVPALIKSKLSEETVKENPVGRFIIQKPAPKSRPHVHSKNLQSLTKPEALQRIETDSDFASEHGKQAEKLSAEAILMQSMAQDDNAVASDAIKSRKSVVGKKVVVLRLPNHKFRNLVSQKATDSQTRTSTSTPSFAPTVEMKSEPSLESWNRENSDSPPPILEQSVPKIPKPKIRAVYKQPFIEIEKEFNPIARSSFTSSKFDLTDSRDSASGTLCTAGGTAATMSAESFVDNYSTDFACSLETKPVFDTEEATQIDLKPFSENSDEKPMEDFFETVSVPTERNANGMTDPNSSTFVNENPGSKKEAPSKPASNSLAARETKDIDSNRTMRKRKINSSLEFPGHLEVANAKCALLEEPEKATSHSNKESLVTESQDRPTVKASQLNQKEKFYLICPFGCSDPKQFSSHEQLELHTAQKHRTAQVKESGPIVCVYCNQRRASYASLLRHENDCPFQVVGMMEESVACIACHQVTMSQSYKRLPISHKCEDASNPFRMLVVNRCSFCDQKIQYVRDAEFHKCFCLLNCKSCNVNVKHARFRAHRASCEMNQIASDKPASPKQCCTVLGCQDTRLMEPASLKRHIKWKHPGELNCYNQYFYVKGQRRYAHPAQTRMTELFWSKLQCSWCGLFFASKDELQMHVYEKHSPFPVEQLSSADMPNLMSNEPMTHHQRQLSPKLHRIVWADPN